MAPEKNDDPRPGDSEQEDPSTGTPGNEQEPANEPDEKDED